MFGNANKLYFVDLFSGLFRTCFAPQNNREINRRRTTDDWTRVIPPVQPLPEEVARAAEEAAERARTT